MPIVAADVTGDDGKGEGDGPVGLGCRMGMWEQSPVGGSSGGAACSLVSHLLSGSWSLYQSSGVPPTILPYSWHLVFSLKSLEIGYCRPHMTWVYLIHGLALYPVGEM